MIREYIYHALYYKTVADLIYSETWCLVIRNPLPTILTLIGLWLFIMLICLPLVTLSYLFTPFFGTIIFILITASGVRYLGRCFAFPGSTATYKMQVLRDYYKKMMDSIVKMCADCEMLCSRLKESANIGNLEIDQYERVRILASGISSSECNFKEIIMGFKEAPKHELISNIISFEREVLNDFISALIALSSSIDSASELFREALLCPEVPPPIDKCHLLTNVEESIKCLKLQLLKMRSLMPQDNTINMWSSMLYSFITNKIHGITTICFPLMRIQILHRYQAERFCIPTHDGKQIDGIVIPSGTNNSSNNSSNSSNISNLYSSSQRHIPVQPSYKGTVIFCMPNAGFYEIMAASPTLISTSWPAFYKSLGYDVCVWNYRGYGVSTGDPSPEKIRSDAILVYKWVATRNPTGRVLVHGESMGGVAAAHMARHASIDLLVCDRTFYSISAVAERLLGSWAAYGVDYVCMWKTDVLNDYIECKCSKIILQDATDMIIKHPSSLRGGISIRRIFGEEAHSWHSKHLPREYVIAALLNEEVPLPDGHDHDSMRELLQQLSQIDTTNSNHGGRGVFSERVMERLTACLLYIGRAAAKAAKDRNTANSRSNANYLSDDENDVASSISSSSSTTSVTSGSGRESSAISEREKNVKRLSAADMNFIEVQLDEAESKTYEESGVSSSTSTSTINNKNKDLEWESPPPISHAASKVQSIAINVLPTQEPISGTVTGTSGKCTCCNPGDDTDSDITTALNQRRSHGQRNKGSVLAVVKWLNSYCNQDIFTNDNLTAIEKVWVALLRIDGGNGQLLGQVVGRGHDELRTWIACLLTFSHNSARDPSLPGGSRSMKEGLLEVKRVIKEQTIPMEIGIFSALQFVIHCMEAMTIRLDACAVDPSLGLCLPLHCGHNGWPSEHTLEIMRQKITTLPPPQPKNGLTRNPMQLNFAENEV